MIDIEQMIYDAVKEAFDKTFKQMAIQGDPGDTMNYSAIVDQTDFRVLLHKEGLWSLYRYKESKSLLYHLCRGYLGVKQENYPVRPLKGTCTGCDTTAPDEIRGLWTLHNFEWVQGK